MSRALTARRLCYLWALVKLRSPPCHRWNWLGQAAGNISAAFSHHGREDGLGHSIDSLSQNFLLLIHHSSSVNIPQYTQQCPAIRSIFVPLLRVLFLDIGCKNQ